MSKTKKNLRAAKKAAREERQAKRVINWIIGGLVILFVLAIVLPMLDSMEPVMLRYCSFLPKTRETVFSPSPTL